MQSVQHRPVARPKTEILMCSKVTCCQHGADRALKESLTITGQGCPTPGFMLIDRELHCRRETSQCSPDHSKNLRINEDNMPVIDKSQSFVRRHHQIIKPQGKHPVRNGHGEHAPSAAFRKPNCAANSTTDSSTNTKSP